MKKSIYALIRDVTTLTKTASKIVPIIYNIIFLPLSSFESLRIECTRIQILYVCFHIYYNHKLCTMSWFWSCYLKIWPSREDSNLQYKVRSLAVYPISLREEFGGDGQNRTDNNLLARQVRYP